MSWHRTLIFFLVLICLSSESRISFRASQKFGLVNFRLLTSLWLVFNCLSVPYHVSLLTRQRNASHLLSCAQDFEPPVFFNQVSFNYHECFCLAIRRLSAYLFIYSFNYVTFKLISWVRDRGWWTVEYTDCKTPPASVLDMTLNNLMVRFQWCRSFGECRAPFYCHCS